jgi:hypothetical protein
MTWDGNQTVRATNCPIGDGMHHRMLRVGYLGRGQKTLAAGRENIDTQGQDPRRNRSGSNVEQAMDKAGLKAEKHVAKELHVSTKDVDKAFQEAATQVS